MLQINEPATETDFLLNMIQKERCITRSTFNGLVGLIKKDARPIYVFNYFFRGECVNHKYRESIKIGAKQRAHFSQDKREDGARSVLFNIDEASKYEEIIFVEGEFDALALISAGIMNVVSVPNGAPSKIADFKNDGEDRQFDYLIACEEELKGKRFILAVDNDGPGYNLRESLALRLGRGNCDVVTWPEGIKDANDYLIRFGKENLAKYITVDRKAYPIKGLASWSEVLPKEEPTYVPCPVNGLDFFNIGKRNLYVVTGIPGHGKSTLARSIAVGMARKEGWHITLGSFEDDIDLDLKGELDIMWRNYGRRYYEGVIDWDKHFSFIFDEGKIDEAMTVEWLCAMMLDAKRRFNTDMVIIDPWNQLDHDFSSKMPETRYISSSLRKFKKTAMELDIVVLIVAHPRKMFGNEIPTLYSISGSAAWNDKVDCGIVVHKENYSNPEDMEVLVSVDKLKRRALGRRRSLCLTFDIDNYQYRLPSH